MKPAIIPFRIEVRQKSKTEEIPWTLFGVAASEIQKGQRVTEYSGHYPDFEFRAVANEWAEIGAENEDARELDQLRQFRSSVIAKLGTDDLEALQASQTESQETTKRLAALERSTSRLEKELAESKGLNGSESDFVYPFSVGDFLKDNQSGVVVQVTAIGRDATGGDGFDYEIPGGSKGYCPAESIEYFEPAESGDAAPSRKPKKK